MKPVYFPFTYVPQWVAEIFAACFKQFIVYQPSGKKLPDTMRSWIKKNVMDICVPVQTEDDKLAEMTKDFRAFASLHGDSRNLKSAAFLGQQYGVPFFGESAASRIISDLKKGGKPEYAGANFDPLFYARVFLDFAQEFDRQSDELNQGLAVNDQHSLELLNMIGSATGHTLPVNPLTSKIKVDNPCEYMGTDRLQAWSCLFMKEPADSGILVTSSRTVFHYLIENLTSAEKIMELDGLPALPANADGAIAWQDRVLKQMTELVESRQPTVEPGLIDMSLPEDQRSDVMLTLYLVPGQSPVDVFNGLFKDQKADTIKLKRQSELTNTLFGLIGLRSNIT